MSDVTITEIPGRSGKLRPRSTSIWSPLWRRCALGVVALISIFMNFYQLGQGSFGNLYYAAGVKVWQTICTTFSLSPMIQAAS